MTFEVAAAAAFPGVDYDLVCVFDARHALGDPVRAARHIRAALAPDGAWLLVESDAGDRVREAALRQVATEAGFTRVRRAIEAPFGLVLAARA